jgi:thiosulfate dehydrogenase
MAGGRTLATPFGELTSTNITPDARTGIGGYSFEQFDRAVRRGVRADRTNLYPAMPYPSYAKVTEDDVRALYAWVTRGVAPVERPNQPARLRWPFSMRWGLSPWKWAFLDTAPFQPDPARSAAWNRGAYLVRSLGHCGACHTPRGLAFQEKATAEAGWRGEHYLAGATIDEWCAVSLRTPWAPEDIELTLRTGRNRLGSASGSMVEVIHGSTQHFTNSDTHAIATYLSSLSPARGELPKAPSAAAADDLFTTRGGLGYVQFCSRCHGEAGGGARDVFPPLSGNPTVAAADSATLLHVTLTGWRTASTAATPRVYTMPALARLSDGELAEILTFIRARWGGGAGKVTASDVSKMRARLAARAGSSSFDTPRLADMLASPNAGQLVRGMRLHLQTKALLPGNVGAAASCASCHLNSGTVADGSPFVGVSGSFPGYSPRSGRVISLEERINGCFKRSMNGTPLPADSADLKAMVAYFDWMKRGAGSNDKIPGRGVGKMDERIRPDVDHGKQVYAAQCAVCHGDDGEGTKHADGRLAFPPLWGEEAFNIGAGMGRTYTAAAYLKANMPIGFRDRFPLGQGGLSDQDAVDVAEYFSHQPRPDFPEKARDWPKDRKPADARY